MLGWVAGRAFAPDELHRVFSRTRFGRRLDRRGYLRFRHWRLYGERGVAGGQVAGWRYEQTLTVECADDALAQYQVTYQPDRRHFTAIAAPELFATPHRSPQLPLWAVGEGEWLQVLRLLDYAPRRRRAGAPRQPPLFSLDGATGAEVARLGDGHACGAPGAGFPTHAADAAGAGRGRRRAR